MLVQSKRQPPKDVLRICEEIVKGYGRRKRNFEQRRLDIVYYCRGGSGFARVGGGSGVSNPVAEKNERLEKLDASLDALFIKAVEQSLVEVGDDVAREPRERLRKAILLNCEDGYEFPYEMLDVGEFSRRDFYRRRKKFICSVAAALGLT